MWANCPLKPQQSVGGVALHDRFANHFAGTTIASIVGRLVDATGGGATILAYPSCLALGPAPCVLVPGSDSSAQVVGFAGVVHEVITVASVCLKRLMDLCNAS